MNAPVLQKKTWITLIVSSVLFFGAVIGFGALADEVHEGETTGVDQTILRAINDRSSPTLDATFLVVTEIGGIIGISVITLLTLVFLLKKRQYKPAIIVSASIIGAVLLNIALKTIFARTRPDLWEQLVIETSYSFPSGHAMVSSVVATLLIILCWRTRYRIAATITGFVFVLSVSFSRLYLGVHFPTDIVGGWLIGVAWVLFVVGIVDGWTYRRTLRL